MQNANRLFKRAVDLRAPAKPNGATTREQHRDVHLRQLHFVYRPEFPLDDIAPVRTEVLESWLHGPVGSSVLERTLPTFRIVGVMSNLDKFNVAHAARTLRSMQAQCFCGRVAINLTVAGLSDPSLPVFIVSQLRQRGLCLFGISVVLSRH